MHQSCLPFYQFDVAKRKTTVQARRTYMALDSDTDALPATRAVGAHRALEARRARLSTHRMCRAVLPFLSRIRDASRNHVPSSAPRAVARLNVPSRGLLGYQRGKEIGKRGSFSAKPHLEYSSHRLRHHRAHQPFLPNCAHQLAQEWQDRRYSPHV